jgi:DNA-binding response OmpR family regulator
MNILLVEDNHTISKGLTYTLEQKGYTVTVCTCCEEALTAVTEDFQLLIIDIGLPDGNGFELYKKIKAYTTAYAIFLTAYDDEDSIVKGFDLGAEDYITKPFSSRELLARIGRITRNKAKEDIITVGEITVDLIGKTVSRNGKEIEFTALEYRIFSMLAQNLGRTVTRELMLEKIWDLAGNYVNDNTLTVYIKRIRQKLATDKIKTVKGIGYRLEEK